MKKIFSSLVCSVMICYGVWAQDFPSTDENGQTIYYKIMSAFPDYDAKGLCIQDNTAAKTGFGYILTPADETKKTQEWALIANEKENGSYYLRCRSSYRFISTANDWTDEWLVQSYATKKQNEDTFLVQALGDNQVSISYEGEYGKYYLCASDIHQSKTKLPGILKNTAWAWKIVPTTDLVNGVEEIEEKESGMRTYDLQGRLLPDGTPLSPGVYIRKTATRTYKIHVK